MKHTVKAAGSGPSGLVLQIAGSVSAVILGVLLLFVPQVQVITLCYVICGVMMAVGLTGIVSFFLTGAYREMHDYQFSAGILLLILGACGLFRAEDMAERLEYYIGLASLVLAVVILQGTVQLWAMKSKVWGLDLLLTILSLTGSILVLAGVKPVLEAVPSLPYWTLFLVGVFSLVSLLCVWVGFKVIDRRVAKKQAEYEAKQAAQQAKEEVTQELLK